LAHRHCEEPCGTQGDEAIRSPLVVPSEACEIASAAARPRNDDKAGTRSRRGGTRHSGPLARACVPYYQHTSDDPPGTVPLAMIVSVERALRACSLRDVSHVFVGLARRASFLALARPREDSAHGVRAPRKLVRACSSLGRQRAGGARSTGPTWRSSLAVGWRRSRRGRARHSAPPAAWLRALLPTHKRRPARHGHARDDRFCGARAPRVLSPGRDALSLWGSRAARAS
jgi:hypothetical protein